MLYVLQQDTDFRHGQNPEAQPLFLCLALPLFMKHLPLRVCEALLGSSGSWTSTQICCAPHCVKVALLVCSSRGEARAPANKRGLTTWLL